MLGVAIAGLIAASAKLVGGVVAGWAEARVAGEVGALQRLEVLDRVLGASSHPHPRRGLPTSLRAPRQRDHGEAQPASFGATRTGGGAKIADLASLTSGVVDVEKGVALGVFAEVRAVLQLAPLVVLLALLAPRLAGSAAFALAGFAMLVMFARRALRRNHARAARETETLLGAADEAVRHADLWVTYGAQRRIRAHVTSLGTAIIATAARLRARAALLSGTSEVLGALALVLTLALVSAGAIGGVDRGAIVPFAIAFFMAYKPLRELVEGRLQRARAEEALEESDRRPPAPLPAPAPASREWPLESLTVAGLVTIHGTHAPLSFQLAPGRIAAIVGPTGIGKTSLLRALLGLDLLRAGTVSWGEEDLSDRGVGPAARPFAWVPQDAPILGDTLIANVTLGGAGDGARSPATPAAEADRALALRVLDELGAGALVEAVGDAVLATDRTVSGGERQWIAVARALATRLPVLLLDEPTASLDAASQERMLRAIAGLRGKRSVVLVTHRTEPLAIADVVVRLDGQDAEDGAGRHVDALRTDQLAIEDVGAVALGEAQREASGERVDPLAE